MLVCWSVRIYIVLFRILLFHFFNSSKEKDYSRPVNFVSSAKRNDNDDSDSDNEVECNM